jgi:F-type H+-transporting ATPase subunit gamma
VATAREIRRRIQSISNIAKITRAMQLVAAARMRRAQNRVVEARPYAEALREVLSGLAPRSGAASHPLLINRPVQNILYIEVTPDRGLCGSLISNLHRKVGREVQAREGNRAMVAIGRKARDLARRTGTKLQGEFTGLPDSPALTDIMPAAQLVIDMYGEGQTDLVLLAYTRFVSTLNQQAVVEQLLPVVPPTDHAAAAPFLYEPDEGVVLSELLPRYVEARLYQSLLESKASEQSARMVAMRSATDNAHEISRDLTLVLNKARQAAITSEIAEIAAGAAALNR